MSEENGKCDVCQKSATHKCGGCHEVYYCGKEHQKVGWKIHKKICRPFKVSNIYLSSWVGELHSLNNCWEDLNKEIMF